MRKTVPHLNHPLNNVSSLRDSTPLYICRKSVGFSRTSIIQRYLSLFLSLGNDRDRVLSPYCLLPDADSTTAPGVPDSHLNADEPNAQDCFSLVVQNNSFGAPTTYVQSKMHNKNLRL